MPDIERASIWIAYLRAFAQCLLEMQGNVNHPAAQRLVRQISPAGGRLAFTLQKHIRRRRVHVPVVGRGTIVASAPVEAR